RDVAAICLYVAPQRRQQSIAVPIGGQQHMMGVDAPARGDDDETAARPALDGGRRGVIVEVGAAIASQADEAGDVLCLMEAATPLDEQRAMVHGGTDL